MLGAAEGVEGVVGWELAHHVLEVVLAGTTMPAILCQPSIVRNLNRQPLDRAGPPARFRLGRLDAPYVSPPGCQGAAGGGPVPCLTPLEPAAHHRGQMGQGWFNVSTMASASRVGGLTGNLQLDEIGRLRPLSHIGRSRTGSTPRTAGISSQGPWHEGGNHGGRIARSVH